MFQYNRNLLEIRPGGSTPPTPVGTPGIYWSSGLGLITVSEDGSTWYTMADKNVGASTVWNDGDNLTAANCGYVFQWGNNYGFPSAKDSSASITTSTTQIDATPYGPNNPYSSSFFIKKWTRMSVANADLRGDTTGTDIAKKGPCATGFHVPSKTEWESLGNLFQRLTHVTSFGVYFKIPDSGKRSYGNASPVTAQYVWTTTQSSSSSRWMGGTRQGSTGIGYSGDAYGIRPFKNTSVTPDSSRTVLFQPSS